MNPIPAEATYQLLLIEDDQNLMSSLALVLQNAGFGVETAVSISAARNKLNTKQYDLVLLDLDINGESGFPLLTDVRLSSAKTKVVILTGQDSPTLQKKAVQEGAKGYLVKPVDPQVIITLMHTLIVD